jgi:polar amino acid transport system substrate-binding protein
MTSRRPLLARTAVTAAVTAAAMAVVACGSTGSSASQSGSVASQSRSGTPNAGTLVDGITPGYPPFEYYSKKNDLVGTDVDLTRALAQRLHMTAQFAKASFASIIPGIDAKRYAVGISGFSDTKAREKVVSFVDYYNDGTALLVRKDDPEHLELTARCAARKSHW